MQPIKTAIFILSESADKEKLAEQLTPDFILEFQPASEHQHRFLDTFDWRLYDAGFTLEHYLNALWLHHRGTGELQQKVPWRRKTMPKFSWDLPDRTLQTTLAPILEERALTPLIASTRRITPIEVNNTDTKTVVRMQLHDYRIQDQTQHVHLLQLTSIRGYNAAFETVCAALQTAGLQSDPHNTLHLLAEKIGRTPLDYSSKLDLQLSPDMSLLEASYCIFQRLFSVMQQNQPGIRADIDTEFLHDYRVAIRRTRSALSHIKGIFPGDIRKSRQKQFKDLGKMTNRLRDLDVYLLSESRYRNMLPPWLQNGLNGLFDHFAEDRKKEFQHFIAKLERPETQAIYNDWQRFLSTLKMDQAPAGKKASKNARTASKKLIRKAYKKVETRGTVITMETPDSELHALRIDCKKLRYLMEFFASLYPADDMKYLIKQLKQLQDKLGDFNDLAVQQDMLRTYLNQHVRAGSNGQREQAAAIGGLITAMFYKQADIRHDVRQVFDAFLSEKNVVKFEKLFN